jgi:hypothetical protein
LTNDDLELVYDTKTTGNPVVGLRFNNTGIPEGAIIIIAYIQFTVDEKSTASCNLKIEGEASGTSIAFANSQYNISQRPRTTNNITWVPVGWKTVGASGTDQRTPDLKNILQEIVNRSDYQSTGGLTFIITGTGKRVAESYEGSSSKAALLHVEYSSVRSSTISDAAVPNQTADKHENLKVILYPNPANDFITVKLDNDQVMDKIMCFNSSGQLIRTYHVNSVGEYNIDCSEFKKGLYFIRIQSSNLQGVSKFVIK